MWSELWSPRLRQGDVFGEVDFPLPKTGFRRITQGGPPVATATLAYTADLLVDGSSRFAVVISHCCEFNDRKRQHFLMARLQGINLQTAEDLRRLDEMRSGNDYRTASENSQPVALDSFLVEPIPGAFDQPMVLNFASITPCPMSLREQMLKLKKAEMTHDSRKLLRDKVAMFFARPADDIPDERKIRPPDDTAKLSWQDVDMPGAATVT